jgi:dienelactone hydrolase
MQLEFFDCVPFYGIYFEQVENKEDAPFVFVLHGGGGTPELISGLDGQTWNYNQLLWRIISRGANAFVPQFLLWNQENYGNEYNRLHIDGKLRQLGGSITALELYFLRGALDYFMQEGMAKQDKIGVAGLSYGGMYALHFAALDTRVKSCYSCSFVASAFENSRADWSYFNAQNSVSLDETVALVSPRALVVAMGDKDELFSYKSTMEICEKASAFFREFNKQANLKLCIFEGTHEADNSEEEIEFLFANLK